MKKTSLSLACLLVCLWLLSAASSSPAQPLVGGDAGLRALGVKLVGVVDFEGQPHALVSMQGLNDDLLIAEGDLLEGFTVRKIEKDEMQLVKGGCTLTLSLKGGEPKVTQPDGSLAPVAGAPAAATLRIKRLASVARLKRTLASRPATVMASAAMKRTLSASSSALASLDEGGRPQFLRPLNVGYVSSPFGWRVPPGRGSHRGYGASSDHKGTDIAAPQGSPVHVAADGVVVESTWSYAKGNFIEVRHAGGYSTCYYHMSKRIAQVGQRVEAGETIGAVGNTGISFGPHLHFEVHTNGIPVDPSNYVRSLRVR